MSISRLYDVNRRQNDMFYCKNIKKKTTECVLVTFLSWQTFFINTHIEGKKEEKKSIDNCIIFVPSVS